MLARCCRPEVGFFLVIWLVLLGSGRSSLLRDPGTFWHTVVGERMLSTGELVRADRFSFTRGGEAWAPSQWLPECGMALVHRLAGFDGLLLVTVTLLAAMYAWLAGRLLRAGLHWLPTALLLVLVIAASSYHFHARPHLLTIALLGWTFASLCDVEAGRVSLQRLLWMIPVFVLWVNLHGGVLAGIALVGLVFGLWIVWRVLGRNSPLQTWREVGILAVVGLGLVLATIVNPFGLELPRAWQTIMTADLPKFIQEHAPLQPADHDGVMVLLLALVYAIVFLGALRPRPRATWLVPLVFLFLTFGRIRHGPLFAITAGVAIAEMLPHCRWFVALGARSQLLALRPVAAAGPRQSWWSFVLPALLVMLSFCLQASGTNVPVIGAGWARLDRGHWPVEILPDLKAHESSANPRIFNELSFGGFLIYYTPEFRIFIDDRCELYGNAFLLAYDEAARTNPAQLDAWQKEYGFRLALTRTGSTFDEYLRQSGHWQIAATCQAATLHRRVSE